MTVDAKEKQMICPQTAATDLCSLQRENSLFKEENDILKKPLSSSKFLGAVPSTRPNLLPSNHPMKKSAKKSRLFLSTSTAAGWIYLALVIDLCLPKIGL